MLYVCGNGNTGPDTNGVPSPKSKLVNVAQLGFVALIVVSNGTGPELGLTVNVQLGTIN